MFAPQKYTAQEIVSFQKELVAEYKYKALPPMYEALVREIYEKNIPAGFCLTGAKTPLYTTCGTKIARAYDRIVVGDYGAFVEISPNDIASEKIVICPGQEYRQNSERYHVKYIWKTVSDGSNCKIYDQVKTVEYADYRVGYFYVSPCELALAEL